ncbi:MAG: hypothetical protein ACYTFI_28085, partial [Planctomycetota bacterium]
DVRVYDRALSAEEIGALAGMGTEAVPAAGSILYRQDPGPDGLVLIEAEDFSSKADAGAHRWEPVTSPKGFRGKGAMKASPDQGTRPAGNEAPANSPRLDYRIEFVRTGRHYLWVRMYGADKDGDSCHAGIDGKVTVADFMATVVREYSWVGRLDYARTRGRFDVPTPGTHTVNVWMREDGTIVDAIAVTTNPKWTPARIKAFPLAAGVATKAPTKIDAADLTRGL